MSDAGVTIPGQHPLRLELFELRASTTHYHLKLALSQISGVTISRCAKIKPPAGFFLLGRYAGDFRGKLVLPPDLRSIWTLFILDAISLEGGLECDEVGVYQQIRYKW
jgi:hypothetical protein